jgi:hypothetical protein
MESTDHVLESLEREWRNRRPRGYGLPLVAALCGLWFVIGVVTTRTFLGDRAPVVQAAPSEFLFTTGSDFPDDYQP